MGELRDTFECGPSLRIEAQERVTALQFKQMHIQLAKIEAMMERLERRLWLTVYGVVGVILAQALESILIVGP
ncbi:MAG: GTA head formation protein, RCAP_rcc01685 family [Octadecabacter sp.]